MLNWMLYAIISELILLSRLYNMDKQGSGVFVTGTDTGVGKTWLGQLVIQRLKTRGIEVMPRKPVESGWKEGMGTTDAELLAKAAHKIDINRVCANRFGSATSPARAAAIEGRELLLKTVVEQCRQDVFREHFLYVEGAGGFMSPITSDALNADLAQALNLPVLLVVNNQLGCINHTLLTERVIDSYDLKCIGIVLNQASVRNREDIAEMDNANELKKLTDTPVYELQHNEQTVPGALLDLLLKNL